MFHVLEQVQGFIGHGVFGIGFEHGEWNLFGAFAILGFDGFDDAGYFGEEVPVGGDAVEDVVEDGGGVGVVVAARGGVEELEGREVVLLCFEEFQEMMGRQRLRKLHHGMENRMQ